MKLKTWLLLSYLIVMILPLIAAYLLFAWINSYNNDEKVTEFFQTSIELQEIKSVLDDPILYKPKVDRTEVEKITNEQLSIVLYNQDGLIVYSSNPAATHFQPALDTEKLYGNLYALEQGYRTFSYKQPVFDDQRLVGFFHVDLARDEWVAGVSDRSLFTICIFFAFFLLIYIIIARLVNRKLNRRLTGLINDCFCKWEDT